MGTRYHITIVRDATGLYNKDQLKAEIDHLLHDINKHMSTYQTDSDVSRFNRYPKTDWFPVSSELASLVSKANAISQQTHGLFDITSGSLVNLWGFGPELRYKIPENTEIKHLLQLTGYQLIDIRLKPPAIKKNKIGLKIDLSAIAKGYAVDQVSDFLLTKGIHHFIVEIGGELRANGTKKNKQAWRIAIEKPDAKLNFPQRTISIYNKGVATSGDYKNYYTLKGKHYSHIINPKTGYPTSHNLTSATVIMNSTSEADALATALLVMGEEQAKRFSLKHNIPVVLIIHSGDSFNEWNSIDLLSK